MNDVTLKEEFGKIEIMRDALTKTSTMDIAVIVECFRMLDSRTFFNNLNQVLVERIEGPK